MFSTIKKTCRKFIETPNKRKDTELYGIPFLWKDSQFFYFLPSSKFTFYIFWFDGISMDISIWLLLLCIFFFCTFLHFYFISQQPHWLFYCDLLLDCLNISLKLYWFIIKKERNDFVICWSRCYKCTKFHADGFFFLLLLKMSLFFFQVFYFVYSIYLKKWENKIKIEVNCTSIRKKKRLSTRN